MLKGLFVGDIVGDVGLKSFTKSLAKIKSEEKIDVVIVNGENSGENGAINLSSAEYLLSSGADVITTGNHVFRNKNIYEMLEGNEFILRPYNYSPLSPGKGCCLLDLGKARILVVNLSGRVYMDPCDDPFAAAEEILRKYPDEKNIIIDFHAEATSEKYALANYLKGRVSAVIGTHTHVQTNDAKILGEGLGYITDAGMTGPYDSILGIEPEDIIERFTKGLKNKFRQASGIGQFCGVLLTIDEKSGKTAQITPINNIHF